MGGANLPYAISQDGNYTLYNGASPLHSAAVKNPIYDSNGQIITNNGVDASNLYIYYKYGNNPYIPSPDSVWAFGLPDAPQSVGQRKDDRGNHRRPAGCHSKSLLHSCEDYQSPVKTVNDPCPAGWCIPTQDEWERIGYYNCLSYSISDTPDLDILPDLNGVRNIFRWVIAICGGELPVGNNINGKCVAGKMDDRGEYGVYLADDLENRPDKSADVNLIAPLAPEPFLFLSYTGNQRYRADYSGRQYGHYWTSTLRYQDKPICLTIGGVSYGMYFKSSIRCGLRCEYPLCEGIEKESTKIKA